MQIQLVRHATLLLEYAGMRLLVDPMLSDAGAMPAIENSPQPRRNPLVPLPCPATDVVSGIQAVLVTHTPVFRVPLEVYGRDSKGSWRLLTKNAEAIPRAPQDLRLDASRALRRAGYRYVLAPTGSGGNAPIGNVIVGHEAEWGMERVGEAGRFYLLRVK